LIVSKTMKFLITFLSMLLLAKAQVIPSEGTWIDDLSGWSVGTSTCGGLGTIVGGYNIASTIAIEKEFTLPDASCKARIQMDFIKIDSWDNEYAYVYINDKLTWQGGPYQNHAWNEQGICGVGHHGEQVIPIDIMSTESSKYLKISVSTNLGSTPNDESFGIQNIRITAQDCSDTTVADPVDCVGTWSTCDADCEKEYSITSDANEHGAACPATDGQTETCASGEGECPDPVDCVGSWSTCNAECTKTYTVTTYANQFGTDCLFANDDTAHCAHGEDECPSGCAVSLYDIVKTECGCAVGEICGAHEYCYKDTCHETPRCHRPEQSDDAFYGAKLHGTWNAATTSMALTFPMPSYMTLESISWLDAQNAQTLAYGQTDAGLWAMTSENPCVLDYALDVNQDTFFGEGSRFTLTGMQMNSILEVDVSTSVTSMHNGHAFVRDREISNVLPLLVNLVEEITITADFKVTYAAEPAQPTSVVIDVDPETVDEDTLLEECQETYGDPHGITCVSVEPSEEGMTQVDFEGDEDDINDAVDDISDNGWETDSTGPVDGEAGPSTTLEPEEFLLFLDAHDNFKVETMKTITLIIEVHSRGCIDHDAVGGGVSVDAGSLEHIEPGTNTTFVWQTDESGNINQDTDYDDLCVEIFEWTFAPKEYESGAYDVTINLDFDLKGTLPSFTASASIRLEEPADVLEKVGFETAVTMYEDEDLTTTSEAFVLGQRFYAKIVLSNLVVNTASITCEAMTVTQTDDFGDDEVTNMMEDIYKFEQTATDLANTAICSAELESPHFHVSLDGWETELEIELSITYVQGKQENVLLRRRLMGKNNLKETAVSDADHEDEFFANAKREPEEKNVNCGFSITAETESMLASFVETWTENSRYAGLFLVISVVLAGFAMNQLLYQKTDAHKYLLDEEV